MSWFDRQFTVFLQINQDTYFKNLTYFWLILQPYWSTFAASKHTRYAVGF